MQKKHIITIGGRPGSGKSTTAKLVAGMLGYERFSSGDVLRKMATERGLTIEMLNAAAETDVSIDQDIDAALRDIGEKHENLVIDSRLAFHWIPYSYKVYLDLPIEEAARRIFRDKDEVRAASSASIESAKDAERNLRERLLSEQRRYKALYDIDPYDASHFDLIVDTSIDTPDTIAQTIVDNYRTWCAA